MYVSSSSVPSPSITITLLFVVFDLAPVVQYMLQWSILIRFFVRLRFFLKVCCCCSVKSWRFYSDKLGYFISRTCDVLFRSGLALVTPSPSAETHLGWSAHYRENSVSIQSSLGYSSFINQCTSAFSSAKRMSFFFVTELYFNCNLYS